MPAKESTKDRTQLENRRWSDFKFTPAEWKAIQVAFPRSLPAGVDLKAAQLDLEAAAATYLYLADVPQKLRVGLPVWRKTVQLLYELLEHAENADGHEEIAVSSREHLRSAFIMWKVHQKASYAQRGTSNPNRESLYRNVLSVWTRVGGELRFSRSSSGVNSAPGGPAIRFLQATLRPILKDDMPGPEALASLIKRARSENGDVAGQKNSRSTIL
jgi:hypothetical protein